MTIENVKPPMLLDLRSRELFERLVTEDQRPDTAAATHLVGGIAKAGSALENFLREVVRYTAEHDDCDPRDLLTPVGGPQGKKPSFEKSMAGPLAHGIKQYFAARPSVAIPVLVRPVVQDLMARDSRIIRFIDLRNRIVKGGGDPKSARDATRELKRIISAFRNACRWE